MTRAAVLALLLTVTAAAGAAEMKIDVWTAPSSVKILQDAKPPAAAEPVQVAAARNEWAAFQVALRASAPSANVTARLSDIKGPSRIGRSNVRLWQEHFVNTNAGMQPDPLSPLKTLTLAANVTQPIFAEVLIPSDARPGNYSAVLSILNGSVTLADVPVAIKVYDLTIPVAPSLRTAFGLNYEYIPSMEKIRQGTATYQKYREQYYELMLDHRLSPYTIPAELTSPEAEKYLNDPRMTSYVITHTDDDAKQKAILEHLQKGGWLDKGYFYVVDEPVNQEQYDSLIKVCERLRKMAPGVKIVSPYFRGPEAWAGGKTVYDLLDGKINIWCYVTNFYDGTALAKQSAKGDEVWNYVCCGPGKPYANFHMDMDAIDHRMLFWQEWKYRSEGLLYWSANYWSNNDGGTVDPWTDMATVKWIRNDLFGDGSLLYPGKKVGHFGALPSLRLKMIRQGLQDYEYCKLAEARAGSAAVDAVVNSQTASWTEYQKDPKALEAAKAKLAQLAKQ